MSVLREASNLQFLLMVVALVTGIMIVLQATVRRAVWGVYLLLFLGSLVGLLASYRLGG